MSRKYVIEFIKICKNDIFVRDEPDFSTLQFKKPPLINPLRFISLAFRSIAFIKIPAFHSIHTLKKLLSIDFKKNYTLDLIWSFV